MHQPLSVTSTITIQASPDRVWNALTNPEMTRKYMFGCEALSDWRPGSPLIWKGHFNGVEMVAVKGTVVTIEPGRFLAYTTIDPNNPAIPDLPANYLTVTYDLTPQGDQTLLTVSQGDYSTVADGDQRYQETIAGGGWTPILVQIKELLETPV
ncbi:MAG TPA: SRPBCC domain-containing protein [Puia sp.]|nr:SRPBCC domain-containing protein [Puia sp.]